MNTNISEIPTLTNRSYGECGGFTKSDAKSVMIELNTKLEFIRTIVEILVRKYERHHLEYATLQQTVRIRRKG
jgi:chaperonin cofactor prefoldin